MTSSRKMPRELRWCCKLQPILLLCVFALAMISISHAQNISGFVSIDCGLPPETGNYNDGATGIPYSTDAAFVASGENSNIARQYITDSLPRQLWTVRSFPQGTRNCYNLTAIQGKGQKYLIRATFMYGNYDGKNQTTSFDLHLGVERWVGVSLNDSNSIITKEIIHVPSSDYVYVCLVNLGTGTPFISALELRPLDQDAYLTNNPSDSLASSLRLNLAPADPNKTIRYPDDSYDRLWQPSGMVPDDWTPLNTTLPVNVNNNFRPPAAAMQTAVTPQNANGSLNFNWKPRDPNVPFYLYLHFAEVEKLQSNDYRAFYVNLENQRWLNDAVVPQYLLLTTVYATGGNNKASFDYSLVKTENSTLPPII